MKNNIACFTVFYKFAVTEEEKWYKPDYDHKTINHLNKNKKLQRNWDGKMQENGDGISY